MTDIYCWFFKTQERKELIKGSYRDRHFNAGSILLGFGVSEAVFGGLNTWFRTGKLFPGPHLYAGAGNYDPFHLLTQNKIEKQRTGHVFFLVVEKFW